MSPTSMTRSRRSCIKVIGWLALAAITVYLAHTTTAVADSYEQL
jgi:hypothetical protein